MQKPTLKTLYLVSTPIGNLKDISYRALEILRSVPLILIEEYKTGKKILDLLKIDLTDKILLELNEHVENTGKLYCTNHNTKNYRGKNNPLIEVTNEVLTYPEAALISDAGTPVIADPGTQLVKKLIHKNVTIKHISGASAILSAAVISGFDLNNFYYAGFLPQSEPQRLEAIKKLFKIKELIIIMETPYRLAILLNALKECSITVAKENLPLAIAFDLSLETERVYRGTIGNAQKIFSDTEKNRSPFVIVLNNR